MILKRFFPLLLGMVAAVGGFSSCENIDEADRWEGPLPFEVRKNVLIEDFTGQMCLNCPLASEEVHKLQEAYGAEHVIAVAIHGGALSISKDKNGLATDEGNAYVSHWGIDAFPKGKIDRGNTLDYQSWGGAVYTNLQKEAAVGIALSGNYDAATRMFKAQVSLKASEAVAGHLQLWLTEDNITALQRLPEGSMDRAYVHSHVFRQTINGLWGDAVQVSAGEESVHTYEVQIPADYVAENLNLVAFVYNDSGVLQVEQLSVCSKN